MSKEEDIVKELSEILKPDKKKEELNISDKSVDKLTKAVASIKVEVPSIVVPKIDPPKVTIPTIKVPKQEVNVSFPKLLDTRVVGLEKQASKREEQLGEISKKLDKEQKLDLSNATKDKPIPVELIFDKESYKAQSKSGGVVGRISLKDSSDNTVNPATSDNENSSDRYKINDIDDSTPSYYGFEDPTGNWYIMRESSNAFRYTVGTGAYATAWTNRASHSYDLFSNIIII